MARSKEEIAAQIKRMEVSALDTRFDAQMRGMFRRTIRQLRAQLAA